MFQVIRGEESDITLSKNDDVAYIQGNNDTVRGGQGDDWLATVLRGDEPEHLATTLIGGKGNDTLHAALTLDSEAYSPAEDPGSLTVLLDGGSGDDEIDVNLASIYAPQQITIAGGAGADTITATSTYSPRDDLTEHDYHDAGISIDGGLGDDTILMSFDRGPGGGTVHGGGGDDKINVGGGYVDVYGDDGNDTISAGSWQAFDWGGGGVTTAYGGDGDDSLDLFASAQYGAEVHGSGGDGNDRLKLFASGYEDVKNFADGGDGSDIIELTALAGGWGSASATNEAHGGGGSDTISVEMELTNGGDSDGGAYIPRSGLNLLYGDEGDDWLSAKMVVEDDSNDDFHSELYGGAGNDRLKVSGGDNNILWGNQGNDTLLGSGNSDRLIGGQGADYLKGNGGADVFEFWGARGLSAKERDRIADYTIGEDLIDVSRIDANVFRSGNQAFRFATADEWHGTGRIWVEDNPDTQGSIVYANTGRAMLAINLLDGRSVSADDYSASDFIL